MIYLGIVYEILVPKSYNIYIVYVFLMTAYIESYGVLTYNSKTHTDYIFFHIEV